MSNDESGLKTGTNDSPVADNVAIRLKLIRELFGVSQRELAKRAGVTNSNISMIELGQVSPSIQSLERILSVIPISLSAFFDFQLSSSIRVSRSIDVSSALFFPENNLPSPFGDQLYPQSIVIPAKTAGNPMVLDGDICGVVVMGMAQLKIVAAVESLVAGDAFYIPSRQLHQFTNAGEVPLKLFICSNFGRSR